MATETQQATMNGDDAETIAIDEDGEVTLPVVEVLTGRAFLTGKSGAGKSNSASVVAEELLDRGFPLLIVDTDGEYWGLKEEYEILHVGADEECDLQVSSEHAPKLAELALEDNVPIILDVSGFLDEDEGDGIGDGSPVTATCEFCGREEDLPSMVSSQAWLSGHIQEEHADELPAFAGTGGNKDE